MDAKSEKNEVYRLMKGIAPRKRSITKDNSVDTKLEIAIMTIYVAYFPNIKKSNLIFNVLQHFPLNRHDANAIVQTKIKEMVNNKTLKFN